MEAKQKEIYDPPRMEILEVKSEGIICASGGDYPGFPGGGGI